MTANEIKDKYFRDSLCAYTHVVSHVFASFTLITNRRALVVCERFFKLIRSSTKESRYLLFIRYATRTIPGRLVPRRLMTRDVYPVNNREDWNVCTELQANRDRERNGEKDRERDEVKGFESPWRG